MRTTQSLEPEESSPPPARPVPEKGPSREERRGAEVREVERSAEEFDGCGIA